MNIGVNFFGLKQKLYHDFDGTLMRLKADGITSAEVCIAFGGTPELPEEVKQEIGKEQMMEMTGGIWDVAVAAERIARVRAQGLTVTSVHAMVLGGASEPGQLIKLLPILKTFAAENQIRYYVISLMKDRKGMEDYVAVLRQMSEELAQEGVFLLYHNHETECMAGQGESALDYILSQCPKLKLELDVGWAKFAGISAVDVMKKYKDRLALLHFKDIRADACEENRNSCFTAVGEGSIPLDEILAEAKHCPLDADGLIIDQDNSPTDILDDVATGVKNINRFQ